MREKKKSFHEMVGLEKPEERFHLRRVPGQK